MPFYSETLDLPESGFTILRDLIHERMGLFYENGKREMLATKLSPLVVDRGLNSFLDYYYLLKYDEAAYVEWERVIDALSVQETYFWREFDQIRALVEVVTPAYFASNRHRPLRIWSAACATGEEPLTIAMALDDAGWFGRAPIEIYASDASPAAIAKARKGIYRERSFRSLSERLRTKYFVEESGGWRIAPAVHAHVQWSVINLLAEAEIAPFAKSTVIFCRNVLIYFSERAIRLIANRFFQHMSSPGYLFLGAAESLLHTTANFDLQEVGGAFVYLKH